MLHCDWNHDYSFEQTSYAMKIKSVLVTELHPKATEQDVLDMFMYCGPVERIEILKNKAAPPPTHATSAVIQYSDPAAVQMALMLTRAIILGKAVQVVEYHEETKQEREDLDTTNQHPPQVFSSSSSSAFATPSASSRSSAPTLTRQPSSQQIKPPSRPSTPTFSSIFSSSSNPSSAPLFSIFSSSPPKSSSEPTAAPQRSVTPTFSMNPPPPPAPLFNFFSSSPPKHSESTVPRSAPIPIAARPAPSSSSYSFTPPSQPLAPPLSATPPSQFTPPIAGLLDKHQAAKSKSAADDLEEILHISEKVETVTALATEIANKASAEAKQFDEKYSITSKFNALKAKALSLKQEVSEKIQDHK